MHKKMVFNMDKAMKHLGYLTMSVLLLGETYVVFMGMLERMCRWWGWKQMTKEQLKQELLMAYVERQQLDEMFNLVAEDFVDVVIYKRKANDCMIRALKRRIEDARLEDMLNDIQNIKKRNHLSPNKHGFLKVDTLIK